MPVVTVDWMVGRSRQQKRDLAARITTAVAEVAGLDPSAVWVVFHDVDREGWAVGGRLVVDD